MRYDTKELAERLADALGAQQSGGWYRSRGICHDTANAKSTSLAHSASDDGRWLNVKCWSGCAKDTVLDAIEAATGISARPKLPAPPPVNPKPSGPVPKASGSTVEFPRSVEHPAQKWLAQRNLWMPGAVLPAGVRWLPEMVSSRAGSVVAMGAKPDAWIGSWPDLPKPTGVQLVRVAEDGSPVDDKGDLNKRSKGSLQDACCVLGDPRPDFAVGVIAVEGLADGLALASRYIDTVIVLFGTSTFKSDAIGMYMSRFREATIWGDFDGPGQEARKVLERRLIALAPRSGFDLNVRANVEGDPAERSCNWPLSKGTDEERQFAVDLHQKDGLPVWEACRMAWTTTRFGRI